MELTFGELVFMYLMVVALVFTLVLIITDNDNRKADKKTKFCASVIYQPDHTYYEECKQFMFKNDKF